MQTRARLYELVVSSGYDAFDEGVVSFDLRDNRTS